MQGRAFAALLDEFCDAKDHQDVSSKTKSDRLPILFADTFPEAACRAHLQPNFGSSNWRLTRSSSRRASKSSARSQSSRRRSRIRHVGCIHWPVRYDPNILLKAAARGSRKTCRSKDTLVVLSVIGDSGLTIMRLLNNACRCCDHRRTADPAPRARPGCRRTPRP